MLPTEGSGAAGSKFKVQGSNALKRVQGSKLHTEGSGAAGSKFKVQGSNLQAGVTSMKAYHTSQFSTLSSQLSSCTQILTDLHRHIKYILRRNL